MGSHVSKVLESKKNKEINKNNKKLLSYTST